MFPQAPDLHAFWRNIVNGVDAIALAAALALAATVCLALAFRDPDIDAACVGTRFRAPDFRRIRWILLEHRPGDL